MPCYRLPGGGFMCFRDKRAPKPCRVCGGYSEYLCDGHLGGGHTCDAPLCEVHAHQVGRDRHLCPECLQRHRAETPQRDLPLFTLAEGPR